MISAQGILQDVKSINWKKHIQRINSIKNEKPALLGIIVLIFLVAINWLFTISSSPKTKIIETVHDSSFQGGRILGESGNAFYRGREKQLATKSLELSERQRVLEEKIKLIDEKLASSNSTTQSTNTNVTSTANTAQSTLEAAPSENPEIRVHEQTANYLPLYSNDVIGSYNGGSVQVSKRKGSNLIAFPVKDEKPSDGVTLPSGSYVKAKMLTGVDVPEGKTYPVLLVLDFSYVAPNVHRLDLSGCFMIAKAEGDLSTERVQMQASKLSCVSKKGKMFEREVNGFIADNTDGSFAMKGKVNSKQGRVAAMAFMSGVVEGVGKAIQASQTTQSVGPLGGSTSVMTGDAEKYAIAGGASNAASMVAQWYLKQAQSLSPTVSVDSGKDVWIVMKDKVDLPKEFFRKERSTNAKSSIYSYFTRVAD